MFGLEANHQFCGAMFFDSFDKCVLRVGKCPTDKFYALKRSFTLNDGERLVGVRAFGPIGKEKVLYSLVFVIGNYA